MEKFKKENGFVGIDISVGVVIIFIFATIISLISYRYSVSAKEIQKRAEATEIAIAEIEKIKSNKFEDYEGIYKESTKDKDGNDLANQIIEGKQAFRKTIIVEDYTDFDGNENKIKDIVKKITVKISYKFKNEEQTVELSTIISKEN